MMELIKRVHVPIQVECKKTYLSYLVNACGWRDGLEGKPKPEFVRVPAYPSETQVVHVLLTPTPGDWPRASAHAACAVQF